MASVCELAKVTRDPTSIHESNVPLARFECLSPLAYLTSTDVDTDAPV